MTTTALLPIAEYELTKALVAPITDEDLDAMESRARAASDGPWRATGGGLVGRPWVASCYGCMPTICRYGVDRAQTCTQHAGGELLAETMQVADATFCAAARMDVPRLVREVRRLRSALAEARARCRYTWVERGHMGMMTKRCGLPAGHEEDHHW